MWYITKLFPVLSFTFDSYEINKQKSVVTFKYSVQFKLGFIKTFKDKLFLKNIQKEDWDKVPYELLKPTLETLLIMIGINYWLVFSTKNIIVKNFSLTKEQADFWNELYLKGLGEFFYLTKTDFRGLINFPYNKNLKTPEPIKINLPKRSLLLNGAGKDSILSGEILKEMGKSFDFFVLNPTPAHNRIANLVGIKNIEVFRRRDPLLNILSSGAYPSVSTFTFISVLLSELLGYESIVLSNERSADIGNLNYLGLYVNHQWCKSSEAEKIINNYIKSFITPSINTYSLLRKYSELEIMKLFVRYPKYFYNVTSCNTYFFEPKLVQKLSGTNYWCKRCPKCVFLFACFSAFLPKKEVVKIFGGNLYNKKHLFRTLKRILGVEGFKPLDCVGEPEEMILAMHYASQNKDYTNEPAIKLFKKYFGDNYDFKKLEKKVFTE